MVASSFIKIFSIAVLAALSVLSLSSKRMSLIIPSKKNAIKDFSDDGSIQGYTSYFTPEFAKSIIINQHQTSLIVKFVYPDSAGKNRKRNVLHCHGTFVTSIAAGNSVEVARNAIIIDVRVIDANGNGSTANMIYD
ncbi:hypothetical protein C1646_759203 [Rhizophagus diaphanus]|nr:hypothetical protein C1646_759203 [Rhizophagus diaphanus] [Rhizophagus sp. MUCL 43196]